MFFLRSSYIAIFCYIYVNYYVLANINDISFKVEKLKQNAQYKYTCNIISIDNYKINGYIDETNEKFIYDVYNGMSLKLDYQFKCIKGLFQPSNMKYKIFVNKKEMDEYINSLETMTGLYICVLICVLFIIAMFVQDFVQVIN